MPIPPRRYSEGEVSKILRLAMTRHDRASELDGLTLEELLRVTTEAGIDPDTILAAAEQFEEQPQHQRAPWVLGIHPYTEIVETVNGEPTDENWDEVVAELRSAFRGPTGQATRLGKSSEWYGGGELTATQVSLTPSNGRTKVKVRLTAWAVPLFAYGFVVFIGGMVMFAKLAKLFKDNPSLIAPPTFLVAITLFLAAILLTRFAVGNWYQSKLSQMRDALKRVGRVLEEPPSRLGEAVQTSESTDVALRLGNSEH